MLAIAVAKCGTNIDSPIIGLGLRLVSVNNTQDVILDHSWVIQPAKGKPISKVYWESFWERNRDVWNKFRKEGLETDKAWPEIAATLNTIFERYDPGFIIIMNDPSITLAQVDYHLTSFSKGIRKTLLNGALNVTDRLYDFDQRAAAFGTEIVLRCKAYSCFERFVYNKWDMNVLLDCLCRNFFAVLSVERAIGIQARTIIERQKHIICKGTFAKPDKLQRLPKPFVDADPVNETCELCMLRNSAHPASAASSIPTHNGSRLCLSGSIASMGARAHCTCKVCNC